jgi:hypothetical protein
MESKMFRFMDGRINISLPGFGSVEGTWEPNDRERDAAWELYVELVARIAIVELRPEEGSLREALSSLYSVFATTREILGKYGPTVGRPNRRSDVSFGYMAVMVLNDILRPVLAKWHPLLLDYENKRDANTSSIEHETRWSSASDLRRCLNDVRLNMVDYANVLAEVANVPKLHAQGRSEPQESLRE